MSNLNRYVDQKNFMRTLMGQPAIDAQRLSKEDVDYLTECLSSDTSPENLHCDGEISRAQAMSKQRFYTAVINELKTAGFAVDESRMF